MIKFWFNLWFFWGYRKRAQFSSKIIINQQAAEVALLIPMYISTVLSCWWYYWLIFNELMIHLAWNGLIYVQRGEADAHVVGWEWCSTSYNTSPIAVIQMPTSSRYREEGVRHSSPARARICGRLDGCGHSRELVQPVSFFFARNFGSHNQVARIWGARGGYIQTVQHHFIEFSCSKLTAKPKTQISKSVAMSLELSPASIRLVSCPSLWIDTVPSFPSWFNEISRAVPTPQPFFFYFFWDQYSHTACGHAEALKDKT